MRRLHTIKNKASAEVHKPTASTSSTNKRTKQESEVFMEGHPTDSRANRRLTICRTLSHLMIQGKKEAMDEGDMLSVKETKFPTEGVSVGGTLAAEKVSHQLRSR